MKKSLFNLITVAFAAVCALSLASCDFFMHGEELKKELDQQIAYSNAPSVSVYLKADAELGEFLSDGEKSFKVGYDTVVQFTVNQESYVFEKLEAVVRNSPETSRSKSVQFTEVESDAKKGIFKINVKVLEQVSDIMIRPVCTMLPKISAISPALETNGCNQDSAITIAFNKNMNPESFKNSNGKINGLSITNGEDEDLSAYFDEPYFASDNKTLIILPLCLTDNTKFLLPPDESKSSLNIKVNYTFVDVKDEDGLCFTANGTHNYKINKNFNEQEEVTVLVQNPVSSYGSFLSAGEKSCIVGFGFEVEFTLNTESYIFEKLEAVSKNDTSLSRADCVAYENEQYDNENGVYRAKVRVLNAASDILIRPKCTLIENAEVTITQSEKGTKNISPADGTKVQSFINRSYSVSFTPDEDYEFIRWELYDIKTDNSITNGTYVTLEDPTQPSTNYSVTQVPDTAIELALRPVVVERPQIISNTPQNSGILKDSSIQVLFDHDMDEGSIYYTEAEVIALRESGVEISSFLPPLKEEELSGNLENHYGYIKNGLTYYKNIVLTNNKTGVNLNDKYEEPYFENARTLTIPASKVEGKVLDHYTQILVTIEKGFFYSEKIDETTSKPVTLRGIKKWSYQVTNKGDTDKLIFQTTGEGANETPVFELKLEDKEEFDALTCAEESPALLNDDNTLKSTLNFMRNDIINEKIKPRLYGKMVLQDPAGGSGPKSTFTVCYQRIVDGDYVTPSQGDNLTGQFACEYTTTTSQDAFFDGTFDLDLPQDGLYRIWFEFSDRSSNSFYYPAGAEDEGSTIGFYVIQDTGIELPKPIITDTSDKDGIKLKLKWETCVDLKTTKIRYREKNDSWNDSYDIFDKTTKDKLYDNLTLNTEYEFEIVNTDFLDHVQTFTLLSKTLDYSGITITGAPQKTVYLKGENFDSSGLTMTASLTNEVPWDVSDCHDFSSSEICINGKTVTVSYTVAGVEKTATINATYYVAEADALTNSPVKLTDYTGTFSGGVYYKFGDFPQTIASHQEDSYYSSDTIYHGWYLGQDGYFYEKCMEKSQSDYFSYSDGTKPSFASANSSKYFKVEPIRWRRLTDNYDIDGANGAATGALLFSEIVLTSGVNFSSYTSDRTINGVTVHPNNYKYSKVRAYLNGCYESGDNQEQNYKNNGFLQKAFTSTAQTKIKDTTVDNSARSTNPAGDAEPFNEGVNSYACDDTEDKIFLLSEQEVTNSGYGVDSTKIRIPTDYAKANGVTESGNYNKTNYGCSWLLRSSYYYLNTWVRFVNYSSWARTDRAAAYMLNDDGIVPALCLSSSDLPE